MTAGPTDSGTTGVGAEAPGPPPAALLPEAHLLRWLPRAAGLSWLACIGAVGLLTVEHVLGVQHFRALPFVALMGLMFVSAVLAVLLAATNPFRWSHVGVSPWWAAVALVPLGLWVAVAVVGFGNWSRRYVPDDVLMNLARRGGASLMEGEAALRWRYPYRVAGERFMVFHRGVSHPGDDAALMDAYLSELETILGRRVRVPIHWVRGTLIGEMGALSVYGLALGTDASRQDPSGGIPGGRRRLDALDRHEAAHAVMAGMLPPGAGPPTILNEGWAEANGSGWLGPGPVDEAQVWADYRGLRANWADLPPLAALFGPDWYHQDSGPVYPCGAHLVRYLIAERGAETFLELMTTIRPGNVEATFRRLYGADLPAIERAMIAAASGAEAPIPSSPPSPPPTDPEIAP